MRDRQPTKVLENGALRYGVYDETGVLLRYEYLALEDAPSDVGTDLSKANLLTDDTETALFGSAADRTINETFAGIAGQLKLIMSNVATITLTLKDSAGAAIPGVLVQGILSESGQSVYSNSSGVASGYISEGSQTIKVTGYADIADYSETISVTKGTSITKTITLTTRNFLKITSSKSVKFSGNVESVDISLVGGGGGGQEAEWWLFGGLPAYSGGGGGGGYVTIETGLLPTPEQPYSAVIGAGGSAITSNEDEGAGMGGTTSFMGRTAAGGNGAGGYRTYSGQTVWCGSFGGAGGAKGGNGSWDSEGPGVSGSNATESFYTSFSDVGPAGGSGGGGYNSSNEYRWYSAGTGGSGGGGNGGMSTSEYSSKPQNASPGTDGLGGGGGGGSLYYDGDDYSNSQGGKGGSGGVAIRMHLKSAA